MTYERRLAVVEERVHRVSALLEELDREVNVGRGGRPSLRSRVHSLESDEAAANAAKAALEAYRVARGQKWALVLTAINVLVAAVAVLTTTRPWGG